jgi:asparagine synthase (glutamine-hydrolysing)
VCGILGELRRDGARPDLAAVQRGAEVLGPRGPDGSGVWSSGPLALAHRRLSIIDLSPAGSQPLVDPELGLTVVFNGCIYNHQALRQELARAGHRFFSCSDTEVIAKAFATWGTDCVDHFFGMFAFAVAERDTGRLVLARDRLGIKPLYLAERPDRLRFASTLPALVAMGGTDCTLDRAALACYLTFHSVVPPPRTILQGVRKLPPATVAVVEPDGTRTDRRYWEPAFVRDPERDDWTAADWEQALMAALRRAVERRMVADVPVGVLLSGGIDSSLIVALLAEGGQHGLRTFSVGFEAAGGESGDEFVYSDAVARHFATDHTQIRVASERLLPAIPAAVAAMSEPMVSHDCVAFYLLSQEVSRDVKVVQTGQGADEVLGGYDWYPPLAGVAREDAAAAYASVFFDRPYGALQDLLTEEWQPEGDEPTALVAEAFARPGAETAVDAALRLDTTVMLVDDPVKRVDNMTMAWGLEARVPFLDHEVVELAGAVPPALKLAQGGKGVLKGGSRGLLPDVVIDRPKGYFPVPAIRQLSGPYLDLARDALLDPAARSRGLFRPTAVEALLAAPNDTRTTLGSNALWQLALLELWLQAHRIS